MEALAMQMFDVEISTTVTKKIRVKAHDLHAAREIAKGLDERGVADDVRPTSTSKSYGAYLLCPRCGRHTGLYYEADDGKVYCLPCHREITSKQ